MHEKTNTHRLVLSISRAGLSKHTYQFPRAFRIRLAHGLDCSKAVSTSIAPPLVRSSLIGQRFSSVPMSPSDISGLLTRAAPFRAATVRRCQEIAKRGKHLKGGMLW